MDPDVIARANTTVSILRGTSTDSYGDEVDEQTAVARNVLCALEESSRRTYLPAEQATRVVRSYSARLSPTASVQKGDRLRDERTGVVYVITDLMDPRSAHHTPDIHVELSRTT